LTEPQDVIPRSRVAIGSLWAVLLLDAAAVCSGFPYLDYLRSLPPETVVAELDLVPSEAAYVIIGLIQFVAIVVAAVSFIRWFQAAYVSVGTLTGRATKHDPGWTLWGFLVPFLNLFRPQQIMREIWDDTYVQWVEEPSRVAGLHCPADRVNLWWGLFLVSSVLSSAAGRFSWRAVTAADEATATLWYLISDSLDVVAAIVAVLLVRSVTALQRPFLDNAAPSVV